MIKIWNILTLVSLNLLLLWTNDLSRRCTLLISESFSVLNNPISQLKTFLAISISIIGFAQIAEAQKIAKGYIITLINDTLKCDIKVPDAFSSKSSQNDLSQGVEIKEGDTIKMFLPTEIKGYGFRYRGKDYQRVSKPINTYRNLFMTPEVVGPKVNLYSITTTQDHGQALTPRYGGVTIASNVNVTIYTFERYDGAKLFAYRYEGIQDLREKLKDFFSDRPDLHTEIDKKVAGHYTRQDIWRAINAIVVKYNQDHK